MFSEIFFPWGWNATIDGKPAEIARVNYVLRGLRIPAGKHKIEFSFDPQSLKVTNNISMVAVILIYLLCLGALGLTAFKCVKGKKNAEKENSSDVNEM